MKSERKRQNLRQADIAERVNVEESTVSKWESRGLPDDRVEEVAKAIGVDPDRLRPEADRAGEVVEGKGALGDWHKAVSRSDLAPTDKLIVGSISCFLSERAWVALPDIDELARMVEIDADEAEDRLRELQYGEFLTPLEHGEWAMQLKFPEDLDA